MEISELLSQPHDMNPGSTAPYLEGFATQMASVGYTSLTIGFYLGSAIHFGGWVEASGLDFVDINEETIRAFGAHHCECPGRRSRNVFREPIQHVFSASLTFYGNTAPSQRLLTQRPKYLRPSVFFAIGFCGIGDWQCQPWNATNA